MSRVRAALLSATLSTLSAATPVGAEEFDRTLLEGRWGEVFEGTKPACFGILFEHHLSDDGETLVTHVIRHFVSSGPLVSTESAPVIRVTANSLVTREQPGRIVKEWEMIFARADEYKLRADGWNVDGAGTDFVIRRKC